MQHQSPVTSVAIMFAFGLKKTQCGLTMVLLLLCFSICPYSGYPYAEENQDPTAEKERLDSEEDQELFLDEDDGSLEEEQTVLEEATNEENDSTHAGCADMGWTCTTVVKTSANSSLPCCTDRRGLQCTDIGYNMGMKCVTPELWW